MSNNDQLFDFSIFDDFCAGMKSNQIKYRKKIQQSQPPLLPHSRYRKNRNEDNVIEADGMEVDKVDDEAPSNVIVIDSNQLATTVLGRYHDAMGIKEVRTKNSPSYIARLMWKGKYRNIASYNNKLDAAMAYSMTYRLKKITDNDHSVLDSTKTDDENWQMIRSKVLSCIKVTPNTTADGNRERSQSKPPPQIRSFNDQNELIAQMKETHQVEINELITQMKESHRVEMSEEIAVLEKSHLEEMSKEGAVTRKYRDRYIKERVKRQKLDYSQNLSVKPSLLNPLFDESENSRRSGNSGNGSGQLRRKSPTNNNDFTGIKPILRPRGISWQEYNKMRYSIMIYPNDGIIGIGFDDVTKCIDDYHLQSPYKDKINIGHRLVSIDDELCGNGFLNKMKEKRKPYKLVFEDINGIALLKFNEGATWDGSKFYIQNVDPNKLLVSLNNHICKYYGGRCVPNDYLFQYDNLFQFDIQFGMHQWKSTLQHYFPDCSITNLGDFFEFTLCGPNQNDENVNFLIMMGGRYNDNTNSWYFSLQKMVETICNSCHGNHVLMFMPTNDNVEEQNHPTHNDDSQIMDYLFTTTTTNDIPNSNKKTKKTTATTTTTNTKQKGTATTIEETLMSAMTDDTIDTTKLYKLIRDQPAAAIRLLPLKKHLPRLQLRLR